MTMTSRTGVRTLVSAGIVGSLVLIGGTAAGASTGPGLLGAKQLPSGYKQVVKPTTIKASAISKEEKQLGTAGLTSSCKAAKLPSLTGSSAHLVAFEKDSGSSDTSGSTSVVAEVVLATPSVTTAENYFAAVKSAAAKCSGSQTVNEDGMKVKISYKTKSTAIATNGADSAIGQLVTLSAKTTSDGVAVSLAGTLQLNTYRKGADIVEVIPENIKVAANESAKTVKLSFSAPSSSVRAKIAKAAIKDL